MIVLGAVALLRPWWLLALPALALAIVLTRPKWGDLVGWQRAVDPPLLAAMVARGGASGAGRVRSPIVVALVLAILALAGPAIRGTDQERLRNLDATLILLDLSQDVAASGRLREAAIAAHAVLARSGARQAGLILYAGDAYLASALSDDSNGLDPLLFALDDKTVPDPGVRPDRALSLARKILREAHILAGDVVLISGGGGFEGDGPRKEAAALRAGGHRVDTLFLSDPGAGSDAASHRSVLAAIARAGGGRSGDVVEPEAVLDAIASEAITHLGSSAIVALGWRDLGRLLLAAAAVPLLLGFRRVAS